MSTLQPAAVVGLLAAIAIPNCVKARQTAQYKAIVNNLRMIEGAKAQWALENRKPEGTPVTEQDLAQFEPRWICRQRSQDSIRDGSRKIPKQHACKCALALIQVRSRLELRDRDHPRERIMNHPAGSVIKAE